MKYRDLSVDQIIKLTDTAVGYKYNHIDIYWYDIRPIDTEGKEEKGIDGKPVYFMLDDEVTNEHKVILGILPTLKALY